MSWKEVLLHAAQPEPIVFVTVATTGLNPDDGDELIAVSLSRIHSDGRTEQSNLFRVVPREKLLPSFNYHKIVESNTLNRGVSDSLFRQALYAWVHSGVAVLTYNPQFQLSFLERYLSEDVQLFDLPRIVRGADTRLAVDENMVQTMSSIARLMASRAGHIPSFRSLLTMYGIVYDEASVLLPCEQNNQALLQLFEKTAEIPVVMQGALL